MIRVAVTGSRGRLGRAVLAKLAGSAEMEAIPWSRPAYDLDEEGAAEGLLARHRPDVVIHAAAWTDVDACVTEPAKALRRNGEAVRELAEACLRQGSHMILVSTNEVFDGLRDDGRGYTPTDSPHPISPYGASKFAGEVLAQEAFAHSRDLRLAIVRTAWLFGVPGNDFPAKILEAAAAADKHGRPLQVVKDEIGSPTYTSDLADAIVVLASAGTPAGIYHIVNAGRASRMEWATESLRLAGRQTQIEPISRLDWRRPSSAPAWAVLSGRLPAGVSLRHWHDALKADFRCRLRAP